MLEARRTRAVLIALLIVAIALITIDFRDGGSSQRARASAAGVFGPVERAGGRRHRLGSSAARAAAAAEIASLQQQNDQLRAQLAQAQVSDARTPAQLASCCT